jgi:23S rRNA pseudouridine1911/1915/1917 synthase
LKDQIELTSDRSGERLDRYLARCLDGVSRAEIQRWIRQGDVTVNSRVTRASRRLEVGDVVCARLPQREPETLQPWEMDLTIVYEDTDCVVVDKPPGLVVHPAIGHRQDTLVNALLARYPEMMSMAHPSGSTALAGPIGTVNMRPGIVHRLDKDTSGLMVVARRAEAWSALQRQFQERSVEKGYQALLYGRLAPTEATINAPIGRDPRHRRRMAVVDGGREAITRYAARQFLFIPHGAHASYTLAEARPLTGRTHQIRVHLAYVGHPVVGDMLYGRRKHRLACPRQFLHACRLGFYRPADGRRMLFESPLPTDLQQVLEPLAVIV